MNAKPVKKLIAAFFEDESGAAAIIEYTIVFPIVMAIICILIFTGFAMLDKAALESEVERTALYVSKVVADPNYEDITTRSAASNEIDSIAVGADSITTHPYRYLFGASADTGAAEQTARAQIMKSQLLHNDDVRVEVRVNQGVFNKVTVTATEGFEMPTFLKSLNMPNLLTIEVTATQYVNEPAEFIRNADLAIDIVEDVGEKTGITDKLHDLSSKISFFKDDKFGTDK